MTDPTAAEMQAELKEYSTLAQAWALYHRHVIDDLARARVLVGCRDFEAAFYAGAASMMALQSTIGIEAKDRETALRMLKALQTELRDFIEAQIAAGAEAEDEADIVARAAGMH